MLRLKVNMNKSTTLFPMAKEMHFQLENIAKRKPTIISCFFEMTCMFPVMVSHCVREPHLSLTTNLPVCPSCFSNPGIGHHDHEIV